MKNLHRVVCAGCLWLAAKSALAAPAWPAVISPEATSSVAQQMSLNGMPMRIQVFSSKKSVAEIVEFYRHAWGGQYVENRLRQSMVLGRGENGFYMTVQITPTPDGSKGVIAVTHLAGMSAREQRMESQPPLSSRLLSDMKSVDAGKSSRHIVFVNNHSPDLNRERLADSLKEKGLVLEREGRAGSGNGTALFFRGAGKEAIAVISCRGDGTAVVLNTVVMLEESK